jgi:hypothetical protein
VAEHVVAALFDLIDDVRILVADCRIQQDRRGQLELVEDLEKAPVADAIAIVAPRVVARGLRASAIVRIDSLAGLKREVLDVERDIECKPFVTRPRIVLALRDRQEIVSLVVRQLEHALLPPTRVYFFCGRHARLVQVT